MRTLKWTSFLLFLPTLVFADRLGSLRSATEVMLSTQGILNQNTLQSGATAFPEIINSRVFNTTQTSGTVTGAGGFRSDWGVSSTTGVFTSDVSALSFGANQSAATDSYFGVSVTGGSRRFGHKAIITGSLGSPANPNAVYGEVTSAIGGVGYGVLGVAGGTSGTFLAGASGQNTNTNTASKYGVYGTATGANGTNTGLYGSASNATNNYGLYVAAGQAHLVDSMTVAGVDGAFVRYQMKVGSMTGAGLTTCGDATHAIGWSSTDNLFTCQEVTGTGGGGSGSPIAFTTGTYSTYANPAISSPMLVGVMHASQFRVRAVGTTAYFELDGSSVTMLGIPQAAGQLVINGSTFGVGTVDMSTGTNIAVAGMLSQNGDTFGVSTIDMSTGTNIQVAGMLSQNGDTFGVSTIDISTGTNLSATGQANMNGDAVHVGPTSLSTGTIGTLDISAQTNLTASGQANLSNDNLHVGPTSLSTGTVNILSISTQTNFQVADEGTPATQRNVLNFAGAGVSCADDTDKTTCTISGGAASGDNLGNHIATMTLTAGYGLVTTTVTGTAFDATTTSMSVTGAGGLRSSYEVIGGSISSTSGDTLLRGVKMTWPSSGTIGSYLQYNSTNTLQWVPAGGGTDTNAIKLYSWSGVSALATKPNAAEFDGIAGNFEQNGDTVTVQGAGFDDTADECRGVQFVVPEDVDTSGTAEFYVTWYSSWSTTNNVQWYFAWAVMNEGESWDQVLTEEDATSDAVQGTLKQLTETTWTETLTNLGWTAEETVTGWFCRDGDGDKGTDNMSGDARVITFAVGIPRA